MKGEALWMSSDTRMITTAMLLLPVFVLNFMVTVTQYLNFRIFCSFLYVNISEIDVVERYVSCDSYSLNNCATHQGDDESQQ